MLPLLPLLLACQGPELTVVAVQELGPIEQSSFVSGRDGGYSARVFDRSVWLYGDTVLSMENEDGSTWCNNSASWTEDFDASDQIEGFEDWVGDRGIPVEFLPRSLDEQLFNQAHEADEEGSCREQPCGARWALWPGAIVEDAARDRALVFYSKIYGESGEWNFESVGSGIATWGGLDLEPERHEVDSDHEHPTLLWHDPERALGSAALVEGETLYAFGCEGSWSKSCLLGRVDLADALDPEAWRYHGSDGWVSDIDEAETLFDAHTMLSVHHVEAIERYLAVYNRPMDDRIYLRTAAAIEGPWSKEEAIFMAEASHDGSKAHGGMAHAELDRQDGAFVYLTYFRSPDDWEGEIQLVEVELATP